jgi:L-alanine-DL-glutamate epimerase-like enolase superfamily enzyme
MLTDAACFVALCCPRANLLTTNTQPAMASATIAMSPTIGIGIFHAASLHAAACLPDVPFHVHQRSIFDARLRFIETRMRCVDGYFELPVGAGIGVEPKAELWPHIVQP